MLRTLLKSSAVPVVFFRTVGLALMNRRGLLSAVLMACGVLTAAAHQPYESSALARLEGEGIELTVTASLEIAKLLVEKTAAPGSMNEQLLEVCAGLYEVTGDGGPLPPERVFYNEREGESVFSVIYPAARPGDLQFRAVYLDKLPSGYGGSLKVMEDAGKILAFQQRLRRGDANNVVSVRIKPVAVHSAESAHVPAVSERVRFGPKSSWAMILITCLAAVMFMTLTAWRVARNKPQEKIHV